VRGLELGRGGVFNLATGLTLLASALAGGLWATSERARRSSPELDSVALPSSALCSRPGGGGLAKADRIGRG